MAIPEQASQSGGGIVESTLSECEEHKSLSKPRWRDYLEVLTLAVIVALSLKTCVVEAFRIPTGSMENTLLVGDFLLVNKFIYGVKTPKHLPFTAIRLPYFSLPAISHPQRGDVVVFEFPGDPVARTQGETTNYVKRCIGISGDTVTIVNKTVYVNSGVFPFPGQGKIDVLRMRPRGYRNERIFPDGAPFNEDNYGPIVVPKAGDIIHIDAKNIRQWERLLHLEGHNVAIAGNGSVLIDGVASASYNVSKNYYFMMGDNRDNSLDSRFWGFVPDDLIVGKALAVYWSWSDSGVSGGLLDRLSSIRWERIGSRVR